MARPPAAERRVDLLLIAVAVVWGSSYLASKVLVAATGVLAALALRYLVSAVAMAGVVAVRPHRVHVSGELAVGLLLGATQAAVLLCETDGVGRTSATNAGVLISLCIVLTPVLDGLTSRRWLPPRFFAASAVALAATTLLVGDSGLRGPSTGDALMLAAAVLRALHVTASGHLTRSREFDSATLTYVQLLVGAALFTTLAGTEVLQAAQHLDLEQWFAVGYLAVGCSVFAFLVQLWAVRRTSASRASLLLATEPVWAVVTGVGLGGDSLGPSAAAGAALVVAGTSWGQRVEATHRAAAAPPHRITATPRRRRHDHQPVVRPPACRP